MCSNQWSPDLLETGLIEVDEEASEQAGHSTIYRVAAGDKVEWLGKLRGHTGATLREADLQEVADELREWGYDFQG